MTSQVSWRHVNNHTEYGNFRFISVIIIIIISNFFVALHVSLQFKMHGVLEVQLMKMRKQIKSQISLSLF